MLTYTLFAVMRSFATVRLFEYRSIPSSPGTSIGTPQFSFISPSTRRHYQIRSFARYLQAMKHQDNILEGKYPAKAHCAKVAAYLKEKAGSDGPSRIYLQGQKTRMIEDNDEPQPFRSTSIRPVDRSELLLTFFLDSAVTSSTYQAAPCLTVTSYITSPPPP